ncbi:MAG: heme exporter protein CcmB [Kofleriaceae bacterium]|nr:heme exporter protein CcmB [Kofleriaceae bacterium]
MDFLQHVKTLAWKDIRVEFRSREIVYTMTFFAGMVVLLFSFAFLRESSAANGGMITDASLSPGFIWVAVLFSGTLGLSRTFDRERETGTMRGLLLSPMPRAAIFLGKAVGIFVMVLVVQAVVLPLVALFFDAPLFDHPLALLCLTLAGTLGFALVGSVFAAMLLKSGSREVLLPVVLYPILVPLFIAAIKGTATMMSGSMSETWFWIRFLLAYDLIFTVAALWTFEHLVIE